MEKKENLDKREEELRNKEEKLKEFLEKLKNQKVQLDKDRLDFEDNKKNEENKLKEKLLQDEINHKSAFEELKIKTITQLKEDFLNNIKSEYEKVNHKLEEIQQKEFKLIDWQSKLDHDQKRFDHDQKLFESQKENLLSTYKQQLEKEKEIFHNQLEEDKVKKLEEINEKIKIMYKNKEQDAEAKEEALRKKEAELKTKIAEVLAQEKSLESHRESVYKQAQDNVALEIKNYKESLISYKNNYRALREDKLDLEEQLNCYEKFENRDLPRELEDKQQEVIRFKKLIEEETKIKNTLKSEIDKINKENEEKSNNLLFENEKLKKTIIETEGLRSEVAMLKEKEESDKNRIEYLHGENKDLEDRLKSIYSDGTEIKERIKDIKEKPYKEISLKETINETDELKYLESIQKNMKKYGVEYPARLLYAFHTALKSSDFSPLTVLSGVSGTGKSELPKLYSYFGGFNFLSEAVQPTWDSPASMIGYYNTIDRKFDSTNILKFLMQTSQSKSDSPYGLKESMNMILLDEMNLAHIELYFAEFLSKFELRRGSTGVNLDIQLGTALNCPLPLDSNVLWIGTMNEDETTKSLSDKVLDRSFSINFPRPTDLKSRTKLITLRDIQPFEYLDRNTWNKWIQKESLFVGEKSDIIKLYKGISNRINECLAPTGRAIGHRVWQSMEYYINNHPLVIQNKDNIEELEKHAKLAFEEQLVQKIMPKLRGIEVHGKEKDVLENIKGILHEKELKIIVDFELSMENPYGQFIWNSANYLKEE